MAILDLDAKRAARSEAENTPHEVVLGGKAFKLKPRLPLEFLDLLNTGQSAEAIKTLLVDAADWELLCELGLDEGDLVALGELYAVRFPESPASPGSSPSAGRPSKRTSRPRTGSTSPPPATAPAPLASAASAP